MSFSKHTSYIKTHIFRFHNKKHYECRKETQDMKCCKATKHSECRKATLHRECCEEANI